MIAQENDNSLENGETSPGDQISEDVISEREPRSATFPRRVPAKSRPSLPQRLLPLRSIPSLKKNPLSQEGAEEIAKQIILSFIRPYLWTIFGIVLLVLLASFLILVGTIHFCKLTPILSDAANVLPLTKEVCSFIPDLP